VNSILDRFRLNGRVALVTGAGRGIGAAIARAFADAGADAAVCARTAADLEAVADDVRGRGRRALAVVADVNDLATLPDLVARVVEEFGRLDILVNNAGGTAPRPFLDTSANDLEHALHFNVTTAFELTKLATPHLLASGDGAIINISSGNGRFARRGSLASGTAKAAVNHLTRMLAADLAPRIRVNAIAPGAIATDALHSVVNEQVLRRVEAGTPLRRLGTTDDVAAAAVWLASPAADFVTGKIIEVDGGIDTSPLPSELPDL
jgi:7-alpha-hydroxysteroid dehydrogenase